MKIFPAIDIKDKKCVRLVRGDFDNKTEYETSPIDQAEKYRDHGFENGSHFYFVHSYIFKAEDPKNILMASYYAEKFTCGVNKENIFGTQFHPEKSDNMGLKIIDNFINL